MKKIGIVLVIIALGLIGVIWYNAYYIPRQALMSYQTKSKTDVSSANGIYTNSTYGFSVNNPNNYYIHDSVNDSGDGTHLVDFYVSEADYNSTSQGPLYSVHVYINNKNVTTNDFESSVKDIQSGKLTGIQLQLAGEPAIKVSYNIAHIGSGYYYEILHNNNVYRLQGNPVHFVESDLQTLVNSFKFVN